MRRLALAILLAVSCAGVARVAVGAAGSGATPSLLAYSEGASPVSVPRLWLLDVDTDARRPLAAGRLAHNASWSPSGTRLVVEDYGRRGAGAGPQLAIVDLRTGSTRKITRSSALDESPSWSPNGRRIVFARAPLTGSDDGLWVMNAAGGGERHLTYNRFGDTCASWSPDGRRIAFARRGSSGASDLWLMSRDGTGRHRLLPRTSCAAWSPDGAHLAISKLTAHRIPSCGCAMTDLYLAQGDGNGRTLLIRNGGHPTWSPDSSTIAFVRWEGRRTHLWLIGADGSGLRKLTGGTRSQRAPAWQP